MLLHFFVHRRKSCTFVPSKTERFMDRIRLKDKEFELFIPEEEIKDAIAKVAERIREDVKWPFRLKRMWKGKILYSWVC